MKVRIVSTVVLGIGYFSGVCIFTINAEVTVQTRHSTPSKYNGDYLSPASPVKLLGSKPKLLRRAQEWTPEEEQLLLDLRSQELPWDDIKEYFPERSWNSLTIRYSKLTRIRNTARKVPKIWTHEESEFLLELMKTNATWRQKAEYFPDRSVTAVKNRYYYLQRGYPAPKEFKRRWTTKEDNLLLELGEKKVPWKEREKFFDNRTLRALKHRFSKLVSPKSTQKGKFTPKEDKLILQALDSRTKVEDISLLLGRSEQGVKRRIRKLVKLDRLESQPQIGRRPRYTVADFTLMEELVKKGVSWEDIAADYFPERSRGSVKGAYMRYQERKQR